MDEIFKVIGAVIAGLGGSSLIILGLSNWLGKVWANRIFEKEKIKYEKDLEDYKKEINVEMQKLKTLDEKALYITKIQYEKEFEIYLNIWKALVECVRATKNLYPIYEEAPTKEDELEEFNKNKYSIYAKAYNSFLEITTSFAPFYQEDFYTDLYELRLRCNQLGMVFKEYKWDVKYSGSFAMARDTRMEKEEKTEVYKTLPKEIDEYQNKLQNDIRKYLRKLRVE